MPPLAGGTAATESSVGPQPPEPARILVVDDDPHTLCFVRDALAKAGYARRPIPLAATFLILIVAEFSPWLTRYTIGSLLFPHEFPHETSPARRLAGKPGWRFRTLNRASETGLSSDT